MQIEVGEYVRTDSGEIFKVIDIENGSIKIKSDYKEWIGICCIVKHSKNIIDLIEVGDYVNGYYCRYITDINTGEEILCNFDLNEMRWIPLEDIDVWESIVTKEQFKSVEYVI